MRIGALTLCLALLPAACSAETPPAVAEPPTVADVELTGPVSLSFWHAFTSDPQKKALDDLIGEFNRTNGRGITVTATSQGTYTQLYEKTLRAIQSGALPEISHAYETFVADYMRADTVIDLSPYLTSARNGMSAPQRDDVYRAYYDANTFPQFGNRLLSFPFSRSLFVLYQNDEMLRAANVASPRTWAEFERAVMALTKKDAAGRTTQYGWAVPLDASSFNAWVYSMGGTLMAADNRTVAWNGKEGLAVLSTIERLVKGGYAYVPRGFDYQNDFAASRLAFFMGPTTTRAFITAALRGSLQWSIQQIPQADPARARTVQYGANLAVMKSTPEKQLASWLFVKWLAERDQTARWAVQSYFMPVRRSAGDAPVVKDFWTQKDPQGKQAFELLASALPEPNLRGQQEVRDAILEALSRVATGTATPAAALKTAGDRANAILKENE